LLNHHHHHDPRKVFHSFRHAFKDACRSARIEEELHDALTGHTSASVGRGYGNGVPLEVLAEEITKVSYKGLDLSHLHPVPHASGSAKGHPTGLGARQIS